MKKSFSNYRSGSSRFYSWNFNCTKERQGTRKDLKDKAVKMKADTEKVACKATAAAKDSLSSLKAGSQKVGDAVAETAKDV